MYHKYALLGAAIMLASASSAQNIVEPAAAATTTPALASPVPVPAAVAPLMEILPANTDVLLRMNHELNSKTAKVGDRFNMTVVNDIAHNGFVVIPAGTRGVGEVTFHTKKGSFGKSGKMEIELKHLELGDKRIPITGKYRQEGEGGTTATVVTAVLVGVFSAFVTGKSAIVPQGRELMAQTNAAVPFKPTTAAAPALINAQPVAASVS